MNFYIFNSDLSLISKIEEAGFTGNLFVYHSNQGDYFTKIARDVDINKKIKYMVAIRPYVISPEYLVMIHKSIREIAKGNRLQINLISGHIKPDEEDIIRTLGEITNKSSKIDRSKYLIEYVELLNTLHDNDKPDYYVSVTNKFTFDVAVKNNAKIIIPYSQYAVGAYDLRNTKTMISVTPVIRQTQEELDQLEEYKIQHKADLKMFTHDQMNELVNKIQREGINEIIFSAWNNDDTEEIIKFVKQYNEKSIIK